MVYEFVEQYPEDNSCCMYVYRLKESHGSTILSYSRLEWRAKQCLSIESREVNRTGEVEASRKLL